MTNRRNDAPISLAGIVDKRAIATLHFLFNDAAPGDPMVSQLAIPLVIIECNFAGLEILFGNFSLAPGLAAVQFVKFTFGIGVPRIEKLAGIAALGFAPRVARGHRLLRQLVRLFLIQLVWHFDL